MNAASELPSANPEELGFSRAEYEARWAKVRETMAAVNADLLIVDCVEHMNYLFGYSPPAAIYQPAVLPLEGRPFAVVRVLDLPTFEEQSPGVTSIAFEDWDDPLEVLAAALQERGWSRKRVAIELDSHFLPVGRFQAMQRKLPGAEFVDFSGKLRVLRLIKSPAEIALMRKAANIADIGMQAAIDSAGAGINERDCAAALYAAVMKAGADSMRSALMASGSRTASFHGRLGHHILREGDMLHVESIPLVSGYGARLMRSTVIGTPSAEQRSAAGKLIAFQERQYEAMVPGASAAKVDNVLRSAALSSGLRQDYRNITGYTLGYIGLPITSDFTRTFRPDADWVLEPGMVFHMYTSACGMAFSDTVLVTPTGSERLTRTERRLFVRG
jgi:Xaa-Pro dipeptidase